MLIIVGRVIVIIIPHRAQLSSHIRTTYLPMFGFSHFLCFTLFCPPEIPASGFDYINFSVLYFHISLDMLCFLPWSPLFKLEVIEMQRNVVSLLELDEEEQGKKIFPFA